MFPTISAPSGGGGAQISLLGTSCALLDLTCVTGAVEGASTRSGVPQATASGGSLAGENAGERISLGWAGGSLVGAVLGAVLLI